MRQQISGRARPEAHTYFCGHSPQRGEEGHRPRLVCAGFILGASAAAFRRPAEDDLGLLEFLSITANFAFDFEWLGCGVSARLGKTTLSNFIFLSLLGSLLA